MLIDHIGSSELRGSPGSFILSVMEVVLLVKLDLVIFFRPVVGSKVNVFGFCSWAKERGTFLACDWDLPPPVCKGELLTDPVPLPPPEVPRLLADEPEPDRLRVGPSPCASESVPVSVSEWLIWHCCWTKSGREEFTRLTSGGTEFPSMFGVSPFEIVSFASLLVLVLVLESLESWLWTVERIRSSEGFLWWVLPPRWGSLSPNEALLVRIPPVLSQGLKKKKSKIRKRKKRKLYK